MARALRSWASEHPKLAGWAGLGIGMVIILIIAARDVGLTPSQWLFLIVATIGLAGACVAIIGWDSDDAEDQEASSGKPAANKGAGAPPAE